MRLYVINSIYVGNVVYDNCDGLIYDGKSFLVLKSIFKVKRCQIYI